MADLIDIHAHHYPETYLEACRRPDSGFETYVRDDGRLVVKQDGAVALAAPQPMPSLEQRLTAMDAAGIGLQVLSVSAPNVYQFPRQWRASLTSDINDEIAAMADASNGRLLTLASLPLPDVDVALDELDRALKLPGVAGIMLTTTIARQTLDAPQFVPLLEELSRREVLVLVHPTTGCSTEGVREYALALGLDFLAETTNCIARLVYSGRFEQYPGIRWVFSHLGGTTPFLIHRFDNYFQQFPECREHIDRPPSQILERVYFDTVTTHVPAMRCALDTFDVGQFVFGTDYPHVPGGLGRFTQTLAAAQLSDEDYARIGWGTATDLLRLPERGRTRRS
ncbi:amidohydrolase [Aeromicrobium phragmitis]|uniref:Amidohydrolase n=1 Tax=Aeromicrobium phragmitis TaxID=2478914 RepID=A0A3L8PRT6_9ACTN|nr:amidohydrolase family protein [Aeromicrobium phragmitis]RLV57363.1 amidohydrolase [Aeromicrobium phragmitis]